METRETLRRQLATAWKLTRFHLEGLTTEDCLWRPAKTGLHVRLGDDGTWRADWPESEGYEIGPPSIAWITWHIGYWWSMALDHSFGEGTLAREQVTWPGDAQGVIRWIDDLHRRWVETLAQLPDSVFESTERTRWPFVNRPFADVAAWVNIELTKNAAEIGYARFLKAAARSDSPI